MKHTNPKRAVRAGKGLMANLEEKKKFFVVVMAFIMSASFVAVFNSVRQHAASKFVMNFKPPEFDLVAPDPPHWSNFSNILVPSDSTYTDTIYQLLQLNGSTLCHNETTNYTKLEGLPKNRKGNIVLKTDTKYKFRLVSYTAEGKRRCSGGDYFEVDFHSDHYRSRLPTVDFNNGTYELELKVPARWSGSFTLEIHLLFSNWHGMDIFGEKFAVLKVVTSQPIQMISPHDQVSNGTYPASNVRYCSQRDFDRSHWSGRWTRGWYNDDCAPDKEKRYRCLPEDHSYCEEPWCAGPLHRLESNGWSYSSHCSFKLFEPDEAWKCLNNKWILLWGDSNFQDTMRNLLLFILDWPLPPKQNLADWQLDRQYENFFIRPHLPDQHVHVSMVFNGAHNWWDNGEGLHSLDFENQQDSVLLHFNGSKSPEVVIMNSGLHDGYHEIEDFLASVDKAIQWWVELYKKIPKNKKPLMIWRTTVTPAGMSRNMPGNPHKLEVYNHILVEKLKAVRQEMPVKFVDGFDLTFPFHYNNEFSDGGHYGRAPGVNLQPWFRRPHWYFVDVMLAHIWLNAMCPSV